MAEQGLDTSCRTLEPTLPCVALEYGSVDSVDAGRELEHGAVTYCGWKQSSPNLVSTNNADLLFYSPGAQDSELDLTGQQ